MTFEKDDRATLIRRHANHMKHYHANDENMHGPGFGEVDFAPIFEALKDINFGGYVSVGFLTSSRVPRPSREKASNT